MPPAQVNAAGYTRMGGLFVDVMNEKKQTSAELTTGITTADLTAAAVAFDAASNARIRRLDFAQVASTTNQKAAAINALQNSTRMALALTFIAGALDRPRGFVEKTILVPAPTAATYNIAADGTTTVNTADANVAALIAFFAANLVFERRSPTTGDVSYITGFQYSQTRSGLVDTQADVLGDQQ